MKNWSDAISATVAFALTLLVGAVSLIPYFIFLAFTNFIFPGSYWLVDTQNVWVIIAELAFTWVIFLFLEMVGVKVSTALATMFDQPLMAYRVMKLVVEIALLSMVSAFWISPIWAAIFASILYAIFASLTEPFLDNALKRNREGENGF